MDYVALLKEPLFWTLTTVGSIVLSVVGNLLTPIVQRRLASFSETREKKFRKKNEETLLALVAMQKSGNFRTTWKLDAVIEAIHGVGIILMLLAIAKIIEILPIYELLFIMYPALAFGVFYGYRKIQTGISKSNLAKLADKRTAHLIFVHRKYLNDLESKGASERKDVFKLTDDEMRKWDEEHFGFSSDNITNRELLSEFVTFI